MDLKKASELFWVTFTGEYVEILAKYETNEKMPLIIQGYMLDIDQDYYYVGDGPLEVNAAVRKTDVSFIKIVEQKDEATAFLEQMPVPETEEESN